MEGDFGPPLGWWDSHGSTRQSMRIEVHAKIIFGGKLIENVSIVLKVKATLVTRFVPIV